MEKPFAPEFMVVDKHNSAYAIFNTRAEALRWIMERGLRAVCHVRQF